MAPFVRTLQHVRPSGVKDGAMGKVLQLPGEHQAARGSALDGHTDEELMALVRADSRAAFRVLVTRHAATVASFCGRVARDRSAAREVSQAVWLALWDARARWEPRASFRTYLFAIAFSRARNHARGRHRAGSVFARAPLPLVLPDDAYLLMGTISFHDDDEIVTQLRFQVDGLDLKTPAFDAARGTGVPVTVKLTATRGVTVPYEVSVVAASGAESAAKGGTVSLE
jgi:hypothetical protein